ncbi:hypothetical protein [Phenylobacterium sp.]|uniref:hypothetical protein n=1 Tax=Phenylobacterium sp. TaxID=1871053 RepID=UPI0025E22740|nr:hypothetical protein [Phenylobacterium sp.]
MSQLKSAVGGRLSRATLARVEPAHDAPPAERVVVVDCLGTAWRVHAAHMEPLRFRTAAEAEKAGRSVATNLTLMGFDTRLDTHDDAGGLVRTMRYFGDREARDLHRTRRRHLDS